MTAEFLGQSALYNHLCESCFAAKRAGIRDVEIVAMLSALLGQLEETFSDEKLAESDELAAAFRALVDREIAGEVQH